jgi:signal transduction histidine kinase
VNIQELATDVLKMMHVQMMSKKEVNLNYWVDEELPVTISSDYMRLKQCLINIMRNSVKFTFKGSINLLIRCVTMTTKKMRKSSDGSVSLLQDFKQEGI